MSDLINPNLKVQNLSYSQDPRIVDSHDKAKKRQHEETISRIKNDILNQYSIETEEEDTLHLKIQGKQVGKDIVFYRNFFTKFIAKLFNVSKELEINGKYYTVNKTSLKEHLQSIFKEHLESIKEKPERENLESFFAEKQSESNSQLKQSDVLNKDLDSQLDTISNYNNYFNENREVFLLNKIIGKNTLSEMINEYMHEDTTRNPFAEF